MSWRELLPEDMCVKCGKNEAVYITSQECSECHDCTCRSCQYARTLPEPSRSWFLEMLERDDRS